METENTLHLFWGMGILDYVGCIKDLGNVLAHRVSSVFMDAPFIIMLYS